MRAIEEHHTGWSGRSRTIGGVLELAGPGRVSITRRAINMQSLTVMIVEDEPLIALMLEALVEDAGGVPYGPFATLPAAIAAVRSDAKIDVALVDCNLGSEQSWPLADALAGRGVPFAFTSGQGAREIVDRFLDRPVFAKPIDEVKLKRFLQKHMRQG